MIKKIAFIGTHNAGKSTAASHLTSLLKQKCHNKSVVTLEENVRKISKLAELNSLEFTKLAIIDQLKNELMAEVLHDIIVCDRTTIDFLVYSPSTISIPTEYEKLAFQNLNTFHQIYFIRPEKDTKITNDGFRHLNQDFMNKIDNDFQVMLQYLPIVYKEIRTNDILTYDYLKDLE